MSENQDFEIPTVKMQSNKTQFLAKYSQNWMDEIQFSQNIDKLEYNYCQKSVKVCFVKEKKIVHWNCS